jgi:FkbM family methyltransferase
MTDKSVLKKIKDKVVTNAPILERIKVVKALFLEKLDNIISTLHQIISILNQLSAEQDKISQSQTKILSLTDDILENQPFFFRSTGDTVKGVRVLLDSLQANRSESNQQYSEIEQMIKSLQKQSEILEQFNAVKQTLTVIEDRSEKYGQDLSEIQQQYRELEETLRKSLESKKVESLNVPMIVRQSYFQGVEVGLMNHLYSFLPNNLALDIGANVGDISNYLLETGYEVYAFEPFPPIFDKLKARFENNPHFHGYPLAIGSVDENRELFIVSDQTFPKIYQDSTLYNSLVQHSLCQGLVFTDSVNVNVKSLESLHQSSEIPTNISLVKIDTEGFDEEVLIGMGNYRYPVVMAEFWDAAIPFAESGTKNQLQNMVKTMKSKGYGWHIAMYRIWGNTEASYYCNHPYPIENSWGNVFFFQDYNLFAEALKWCSATMPATYLTA